MTQKFMCHSKILCLNYVPNFMFTKNRLVQKENRKRCQKYKTEKDKKNMGLEIYCAHGPQWPQCTASPPKTFPYLLQQELGGRGEHVVAMGEPRPRAGHPLLPACISFPLSSAANPNSLLLFPRTDRTQLSQPPLCQLMEMKESVGRQNIYANGTNSMNNLCIYILF